MTLLAQSSAPWRALAPRIHRDRAGAQQKRQPCRTSPAAAAATTPLAPIRRHLGLGRPLVTAASAAPTYNSQAAADQFFSADDREAAQTFAQLLEQVGGSGNVSLRPSDAGRGLFADAAASPGDVLLRVPLSACLSIAYAAGGDGRVSTPEIPGDDDAGASATWPRLVGGVRRAAAAAEAAAEEAALAEADDEDDGGRPMSSASSGAADEVEALTWDVLLALGVMDALAGDGGAWWAEYSGALFPAPESVSLPMCWSPKLLDALRHSSVSEAARAQQLRLRMLYAPFCAAPAVEGAANGGAPSYMQWAFACVRSRAFRLTARTGGEGGGGESGTASSSASSAAATFALVPFLDCANHSERPNAAYRLVGGGGDDQADDDSNNNGGNSGGGSPQPFVELVALAEVKPGDEVCLSYTGPPPAPATNRLLMAQYGFVPTGGNPRDRYEELKFGAFSLRDPKRQGGTGGGVSSVAAAAGFRLRAVQGAVGDSVFLSALKGEDPYAFAALKSLPLARDEEDAAAAATAQGLPLRPEFSRGSGDGGDQDDAPCPPDAAERALAERLLAALRIGPLAELRGDQASVGEALAEDEALLSRLARPGGAKDADEADPRLAAALRYRVERARLMLAVERVLEALAA